MGRIYTIHEKEKFGTLRFRTSMDGAEEVENKIRRLINEAERKSSSTCEVCGKPGRRRTELDYIQALCDECAKHRIMTLI